MVIIGSRAMLLIEKHILSYSPLRIQFNHPASNGSGSRFTAWFHLPATRNKLREKMAPPGLNRLNLTARARWIWISPFHQASPRKIWEDDFFRLVNLSQSSGKYRTELGF